MMKSVLVMMVLVAMVMGQTTSPPATTSFTKYFSGGLPFCTQCGAIGEYACSPDATGATIGNWNNGVISFTDPIPYGYYATSIVVQVYGAYSCNVVSGSRAMFGLSLNGNILGVRESFKGVNSCKCDTCDGAEAFTFKQTNGIPGYHYRATNSFKVEMYKDSVCLNRIEVTITYQQILSSPPTPLPESYFGFTIPSGYDRVGCSVCNGALNQWCSASGNDTLQLSFLDPLPLGALLISVEAYVSLNMIQHSTGRYTTLTAYIQDTSVGTLSIADTTFRDKCGCMSDLSVNSATYQRGWPNYVSNGVNKVSLSVSKYSSSYGNVCVGRLHLKLIYFMGKDLDELETLDVELN